MRGRIDNDMAVHLPWAEALRSPRMAHLWDVINASPQGSYSYPLGPDSVVATLGTLTGFGLDAVFTGLMMTIIVLMAVVAANVLAGQSLWRRVVVALACSLAYLVAAFYGEGAFKETIMALLLLAFALHLEQVSDRWPQARGAMRWRLVTRPPCSSPVGSTTTATSPEAGSWPRSGLWIVVEVVRRPTVLSRWTSRERLLDALGWIAVSAAIGIVLLLPVARQAIAFFNSYGVSPAAGGAIAVSNLGNLSGPLSPYQAFGIWFSSTSATHRATLSTPASSRPSPLALVVYGLVRAVRSRQFVLPCAATASGLHLVVFRADPVAVRRGESAGHRLPAVHRPPPPRTARAAAGADVAGPRAPARSRCRVLPSSPETRQLLSLRNEPLQAPEAGRELAAFHRTIGNDHVLFLGVDDFAPWQPARGRGHNPLAADLHPGWRGPRPTKPFVGGQSLDFDSVLPADLDNFRYVITSSEATRATCHRTSPQSVPSVCTRSGCAAGRPSATGARIRPCAPSRPRTAVPPAAR